MRSTRYSSNLAHADARTAASRRAGSFAAMLDSESRYATASAGSSSRKNRSRATHPTSLVSALRKRRARVRHLPPRRRLLRRRFAGAVRSSMAGALRSRCARHRYGRGIGFLPLRYGPVFPTAGPLVSGATPSAQLAASSELAKKIATVPAAPFAGSAQRHSREPMRSSSISS